MKLITIKTFDKAIDAHLMKSKLESEGISCYLFDEHTVSINPLFNYTVGGIKLKIDESDFIKAQEVLQIIQQVSKEKKLCLNCGSDELEFVTNVVYRIRRFLSAILTLLTVSPHDPNRKIKCLKCGFIQ